MRLSDVLGAADRYQQSHKGLALPYAVIKKFSDDQAGNLAALLAYYAFFSIFPLLLVLVTVLGIVLHGNPKLQSQILSSGLREFPVIGTEIRANIHSLHGSGFGLAIGIVGTFLGARGVAGAAQNAFNSVWHVPYARRPNFPWNQLRSVGIVVVFGGGVLVTSSLQTVVGGLHIGHLPVGIGIKIGAIAVAAALNIVVFAVGLRLATATEVATRDFLLGAVIAAIGWEILEALGSYVINHELRNSSSVYGTFGLVIGLLSWFYLQAQITLYAIEVAVVRTRGLWPRSLHQPPLTEGDQRAYTEYARTEQRRPEQRVDVDFDERATGAGRS